MYNTEMTYPLKFRQHVLAIKTQEKLTYAQTATRFCVGTTSLMRWAKRICLRCYKLTYNHVLAFKKKEAHTYAETADRFGVGSASLMRWAKRLEPCLTRNKPATKINQAALNP